MMVASARRCAMRSRLPRRKTSRTSGRLPMMTRRYARLRADQVKIPSCCLARWPSIQAATALQILLIGEHGDSLGAKEVIVPDGEQAHQHRQVAIERR